MCGQAAARSWLITIIQGFFDRLLLVGENHGLHICTMHLMGRLSRKSSRNCAKGEEIYPFV